MTTEHAKRLRARGYADVSIEELIMELETGELDPQCGPRSEGAARESATELVRHAAREVTGVRLIAAEEVRHRAASERAHDGSALARLTSVFLLLAFNRPGGCARVELGDTPRVAMGTGGTFSESLDAPIDPDALRAVLTHVVWRLKAMINVNPGPGPRRGNLRLIVGNVTRDLAVEVRQTLQGDVAIVRRYVQCTGAEPCMRDEYRAWREHHERIQQALVEGRLDDVERSAHLALAAARALGDDAVIEQMIASEHVTSCLGLADRDAEARTLIARMITTAQAHGFGPRYEGALWMRLAWVATHDAMERLDAVRRATILLRAPGVGRTALSEHGWESTHAERCAGNAADCIRVATELEADDVAWFGAPSDGIFDPWLCAAHAHLDLGDVPAARRMAQRIRELGRKLGVEMAGAVEQWIEGRALALLGSPERALPTLETARDACTSDASRTEIEADIAVVLAHLGRVEESVRRAALVLPKLKNQGPTMQAVQRVVGRAGPFR